MSVKLPCQPVASTCCILLTPDSLQDSTVVSRQTEGGLLGTPLSGEDEGTSEPGVSTLQASPISSAGGNSAAAAAAAVALSRRSGESSSSGSGGSGTAAGIAAGGSRRNVDSVVLAAATLDGLLYEFRVTDLIAGGGGGGRAGGGGEKGPRAFLEGEWALQGSNSL